VGGREFGKFFTFKESADISVLSFWKTIEGGKRIEL